MIEFLLTFLRELQAIFLDASAYIVFGFLVAAAIQVFLPMHLVHRLLGRGRVRPIFMASLLGIPLPLCSCAVLPTGLALRRRGASPGATASFLISTPESDVDAIVLTWGIMGPLMAIYRPIAAFVTAIAAGFATDFFVKDPAPASSPDLASTSHDKLTEDERRAAAESGSWLDRLRRGFGRAFIELFDETSHWILTGLVISALISTLLPADLVTRYLSSGPLPLVIMLLIGVPLYICASASTPIAAALMMKGLSPGAALVFLLAGPATNFAAFGVLGRAFGRRFLAVYIGSIAVFSLLFGWLLDLVVNQTGWTPKVVLGTVTALPAWIAWPGAVVLIGLFAASFRRVKPPKEFRDLGHWIERALGFRFTARGLRRAGAALALLAFLGTCFVAVPPGSHALVRRFGAPSGEPHGEGLHIKLPFPIERVVIVRSSVVHRIEIGYRSAEENGAGWLSPDGTPAAFADEALFLMGDENIVDTKATVQYRVSNPARWTWGFRDAEAALRAETIAELVEVLAGRSIDGYYTVDRRDVEMRVLEGLRRRVEAIDLGIEIVHFGVQSVHAPPEVHAAFRDVASAQEDKQREINIALRYLDETVNLARGEAAARVESAHATSTSSVLRAEGESASLRERIAAYRLRPEGTRKRLYLETVEEVLSRSTKIVRPGWAGSGSVDLWISGKGGTPIPAKEVVEQEGSDAR